MGNAGQIPGLDRLMKLEEVAATLGGICVRSVYRLISKGDLPPPVKVGSLSCIPASEVAAYIERLKGRRGR